MYIKYPFEVYYLSLETEQNHSASLRKKDTEYFNSQSLSFRQVEVDMTRTFKTEQRLRVTLYFQALECNTLSWLQFLAFKDCCKPQESTKSTSY